MSAFVFHANDDFGLLANPTVVRSIQKEHFYEAFPEVDIKKVKESLGSAIIVDARLRSDFAHGHLPKAINLPPYTSAAEILSQLGRVQRQPAIIVYCQSTRCRFSDSMATEIRDLGYMQISIYREGWNGWENSQQVPKP